MTTAKANGKKSDAKKIGAAERRHQALNLRRGGGSYRSIASQLNISIEQVRRDLNQSLKALAEQELELAEELRALEADRLNTLTLGFWSKAVGGDLNAANFVLRVSERRSKLLGLDKPAQMDITQTNLGGPNWSALQGVVMEALKSFPEARAALAQRLMDLNPIEGEIVQEGGPDALD